MSGLSKTDSVSLLGEVVTWDMGSHEIAYSAMQDALRDAGLNPDDAKELSHEGEEIPDEFRDIEQVLFPRRPGPLMITVKNAAGDTTRMEAVLP